MVRLRRGGCRINPACLQARCQSGQQIAVQITDRVGIGRHRCSPTAQFFAVLSLVNHEPGSVLGAPTSSSLSAAASTFMHQRVMRCTVGQCIEVSLLRRVSHNDGRLDADPTLSSLWRPMDRMA